MHKHYQTGMSVHEKESGERGGAMGRDEERIVSNQNGLTIRKSEMQPCNFVIR